MIKTILVLSDGTEIFAGHNRINAIQSTAIEESCNNGEDLTFGSVCSSKISVNIITPQNQLPIRAGEKITLYEELSGQMRKKGVFNAEKPQRKTANTTNVTAYDNVSLLDKDVTEWFNSLADFPYSVFDMAKITCEHCGLKLKNSNLRNGDFLINEMKLESVTARQILQWVGEVCGYFCIADENGDIFFSWYVENSKTIGINRERDTLTFLKGTLTYEDYTVKKIDRVQIRQSEDDAGFSYPSDVTGGNVYIIQSNPFIIASAVIQDIENVALNLYNVLKDIVYTPCHVSISSSFNFNVGDIIKITDANGVEISAYITKKNRAGNKETLQSSGNFERNGATQLYSTSFSKNYGDKLILQKAITKLNVTADDQSAKIEALAEFQTQTEKNIAQINSEANAQGAKINLVVETTADGKNAVRGGVLAEAINGQTAVKISADVVNIDVVKTLNAKADEIDITSDLLKISSSGFSLEGGELYAYKGKIGKYEIVDGLLKCNYGAVAESVVESASFQMYATSTADSAQYSTAISPKTLVLYKSILNGRTPCINISAQEIYFVNDLLDTVTGRKAYIKFEDSVLSLGSDTSGFSNRLKGTWYGTLLVDSDLQKKRDISNVPGTWEKIFDMLTAREYRYKEDETGKLRFGFIAQELKKAIEEAGEDPDKYAILQKDKDGFYSICYSEFAALCVMEIQKLKKELRGIG
ncbi:MAG: tail fiber domain-containing protein [Clostridia bacterium]|nr:tail fiber domain-containing protein [Clostridia bacterium]